VPGNTPTNLKLGELAANIPDKKIWIGDSVNSAIKLFDGFATSNIEYSLVQDVRQLGEDGGTSREKKWNVRALNTISHDAFNNVSLVGDDFVLSAGLYRILVTAPVKDVEMHKLRIYNETASAVEFEGCAIKSGESGTIASAVGTIVSNGSDLYEIHHYTEKKQERDGLGDAANLGFNEIYTNVEIIKIGA